MAAIDKEHLSALLAPLGYQLDTTKEVPVFWKRLSTNDLRSAYAFTIVLVTLNSHTVCIEGLNEPRIERAVKAGLIEIKEEEDLEELKEVLFECTLESDNKLQTILTFLEKQLTIITSHPIHSDPYKEAISHIELLVDTANEIEW